jgi:hypothetical protein
MNMTRQFKMSAPLADFVIMVARICYRKGGVPGVNEYADKIGLTYSTCEECNLDTPTADTKDRDYCIVCGLEKVYNKTLF